MQPKVVSNSSKGFIPGPKTDFRTAGLEAKRPSSECRLCHELASLFPILSLSLPIV